LLALGLISTSCTPEVKPTSTPQTSPKPEASPTVDQTKTHVAMKVYTPLQIDQVDPEIRKQAEDLLKTPVLGLTGIEAVDPAKGTSAAFFFVKTEDKDKNYAMFLAEHDYMIAQYDVQPTINPDNGDISLAYQTKTKKLFLEFVFKDNLVVPGQRLNETRGEYLLRAIKTIQEDKLTQEMIQVSLGDIRNFKEIIISNPYDPNKPMVILSLEEKQPDTVFQMVQEFLKGLEPAKAYAESLPTLIPTPTVTPPPTETKLPSPTATVKKEATVTPTAAKKELPPEGQAFMEDLKGIASLTPEQRQAVQNGFEKDWNAADTEMKKLGAYYKVYTSLWAGYNVTKDPAVRAEMKKIQEFMASQLEWRQEYKLLTTGGGTFLDEK
jgi:hypothetical protein